MGLVFKLVLFIVCIRYVLKHGRPGFAAGIYAGTYLGIALLFMLLEQLPSLYLVMLGITFVWDLGSGFVIFWSAEKFRDNFLGFIAIIILGLVACLAAPFFIAALLGQ